MVKDFKKAKQVQWTNVYLDALVRYLLTQMFMYRLETFSGRCGNTTDATGKAEKEGEEICFLSDEEFQISLGQSCETFLVCHLGKLHFNSVPLSFCEKTD